MTIHRGTFIWIVTGALAASAWIGAAPALARSVVAPWLTVTPTAGPAGTVVAVTGAGFCPPPCSAVRVEFGGRPVDNSVLVSRRGRFHATFTAPLTATGGVNAVYAEQIGSGGDTV